MSGTSARVDALSTGPKECAAAGLGIPFMPRLGALPHQRLLIRAHLHGFWKYDNLLAGDGPRCGILNRGRVRLFVVQSAAGSSSTVAAEHVLFDAGCVRKENGFLPDKIEIEVRADLDMRLHIAWLIIEACVDPPGESNLGCLAELMNGNRPPGIMPEECDGFATATAEIDMVACAVDFVYRSRTIAEIERERMANELRERLRGLRVGG